MLIQNTVITQFTLNLAFRDMYITLKNILTKSSNVSFYVQSTIGFFTAVVNTKLFIIQACYFQKSKFPSHCII